MLQVGDGKLANQVEPVGMSGPFDVDIVGELELGLDVKADKFVGDGAVVDPMDWDAVGVEFTANFFDVAYIHRANSVKFFGQQEIREGFLIPRIDFHEHHIFRSVIP